MIGGTSSIMYDWGNMKNSIKIGLVLSLFCASAQAGLVKKITVLRSGTRSKAVLAVPLPKITMLFEGTRIGNLSGNSAVQKKEQEEDLKGYLSRSKNVRLIYDTPSSSINNVLAVMKDDSEREAQNLIVKEVRAEINDDLVRIIRTLPKKDTGVSDSVFWKSEQEEIIEYPSPDVLQKIADEYWKAPNLAFYIVYWLTRTSIINNGKSSLFTATQEESKKVQEGGESEISTTVVNEACRFFYQKYFDLPYQSLEQAKKRVEERAKKEAKDLNEQDPSVIFAKLKQGKPEDETLFDAIADKQKDEVKKQYNELPVFDEGRIVLKKQMLYLYLQSLVDQIAAAQMVKAWQESVQFDLVPEEIVFLVTNNYFSQIESFFSRSLKMEIAQTGSTHFINLGEFFEREKEEEKRQGSATVPLVSRDNDLPEVFVMPKEGSSTSVSEREKKEDEEPVFTFTRASSPSSWWQRMQSKIGNGWQRWKWWIFGGGVGLSGLIAGLYIKKNLAKK